MNNENTTYSHGSYKNIDPVSGEFRMLTKFKTGEITKSLYVDVVGFEVNN